MTQLGTPQRTQFSEKARDDWFASVIKLSVRSCATPEVL
jgi:hypothetical protein